MARSIATISLSPERAAQLRLVAKERRESLNEAVGRFFRSEVRAGIVGDVIPGFDIEVKNRAIKLSVGQSSTWLPYAIAKKISAHLLRVADEGNAWEFKHPNGRVETRKTYYEECEMVGEDAVLIKRRGRGLALEIWCGRRCAVRRTMNTDIARDLARILRSAAKKAQSG